MIILRLSAAENIYFGKVNGNNETGGMHLKPFLRSCHLSGA